jgi:hypothetical protein
LISALATSPSARAQEAPAVSVSPPLGWSATADFSLVSATGNADAQTLGFKGALKDQFDGATLFFETGALDAESTSRTRFATRNPDGSVTLGTLDETKQTAEAYFFRGRYDRVLGNGWGWFAGAGWERNEFAGLSNRYTGMGGVSKVWFERPDAHFKTDAALAWIQEGLVAEPPGIDDRYLALALGWDYLRKLGAATTFTSRLQLLPNLQETDDFRVDTTNAVAVAMSERLALKVSWQLLWDNQPAFVSVPVTAQGVPTGDVAFAELDDLDSLATVALVVNF